MILLPGSAVKEPLDKVGYSIFLYDVPPHGAPAEVVLAGVQLRRDCPSRFCPLPDQSGCASLVKE